MGYGCAMRRVGLLALVWSASVVALAETASAAVQPIVSPKADPYYRYGGLRGTRGFGDVKPREIFYGGDPTGLVCQIRWVSWGGNVARGYGSGWYINSHQSVSQGHAAAAIVVASKLGTWKGRAAYTKLTWSFPDHGSHHTGNCA
jgi:hypothetical protein